MGADDRDLSLLSGLWTDVQVSGEAAELEAELQRELSGGHVLSGRSVAAIAARMLRKEVIFRLLDENRWAWVHLTWRSETDPRWPSTEVCETWGDVVGLLRDAERG